MPGIFGPSNLPHLFRDDYVTNSNDSYWLSNPEEPLEGFARIIGDERTERSLRTRLGLRMVQERLAGTDEYDPPAGNVFTQDILQDVVFNNRHFARRARARRRRGVLPVARRVDAHQRSGHRADRRGAATRSAGWDGRDDLDSAGAVLFRRFFGTTCRGALLPVDVLGVVHAAAALGGPRACCRSRLVAPERAPWNLPFDPDDPVDTPFQLDTRNPRVALALGDAIADLQAAGIPLDAGLRGWQYEVKDGRGDPRPRWPRRAGRVQRHQRHLEPHRPARVLATPTSSTARRS